MISFHFGDKDIYAQKRPPERLSILHLGFEDFQKPGSGGGSIRTHEINRRIAKHHDITVLVTRYRGCKDRIEDGVKYVHIGLPLGYFGGILSYFAVLPFAAHKYKADLVVEDFAAPFSSCLSPLWTRRRTIAMVQWMNAREKSKQYHLPFWITEKLGLHLHNKYIAVSEDLAAEIRKRNPDATVTVIGNGVSKAALEEPLAAERKDVLFVGRLERVQKGLDILLDAFAMASGDTDANLIIAGDGPDEQWARERAAQLNIADRVIFKGRVSGKAKHRLFTHAKVVVMPSRFETFGIVAVEALAGGAPVIAFDIPCLRQVVPKNLGTLVPAFDTSKLSDAIQKTLAEKHTNSKLEHQRRAFASSFDWETLAKQQQAVYEQASRGLFLPETNTIEEDSSRKTMESFFISIAREHSRKKRIARVAIIGNYGNGNTGDEAILAGLHAMASPYVELMVLARNAADVRKMHHIDSVDRASLQGIIALLRCDVLAIGGGGIFGKDMPFLVRILPSFGLMLSLFGKDVAFVAIGVDPDMQASTARTLRLLARNAYAVIVRDSKTAAFFGESTHPILVEDPATSLRPASKEETLDTLQLQNTTGRLLISLKPSPSSEINQTMTQHAATAADWWVEHTGHEVDFLCLSHHGDFGHGINVTDKTLATVAYEQCTHKSKVRIIGPDLHPRIAMGLIASSAGIIGARLHALIFAQTTNTPMFGLVFENKSRTYLDQKNAAYVELPGNFKKLTSWLKQRAEEAGES